MIPATKQYLSNFFNEKQISYQLFEITDSEGMVHMIDTDCVIEAIFNTSLNEQQVISQTLRKLDFYNKPIHDYLKYLATALVNRYNKVV